MSNDFIYIEKDWGSLFYKHFGKNTRQEAVDICSKQGKLVHLPRPRFAEENEFYRIFFSKENLWLDLKDDRIGLKSSDGNIFVSQSWVTLPRQTNAIEKRYDWINTNLEPRSEQEFINGVIMDQTGRWQSIDDTEKMDTVCIYNIIPNECRRCSNKTYCRFQDDRKDIECICTFRAVLKSDSLQDMPPIPGFFHTNQIDYNPQLEALKSQWDSLEKYSSISGDFEPYEIKKSNCF